MSTDTLSPGILPDLLFRRRLKRINKSETVADENVCIIVSPSFRLPDEISWNHHFCVWVLVSTSSQSTSLFYRQLILQNEDTDEHFQYITSTNLFNLHRASLSTVLPRISHHLSFHQAETNIPFTPRYAINAKISQLEYHFNMENSTIDNCLKNYFLTPRYVHAGDVICIDTNEYYPEVVNYGTESSSTNLYFKVESLDGPPYPEDVRIVYGYLISCECTVLHQVQSTQCFVPSIEFMGSKQTDDMFSVIPSGLEPMYDKVEELVMPFLLLPLEGIGLSPVFLITGKSGSGKSTLLTAFAKKTGLRYWSRNCMSIQNSNPAQTEAMINNIFTKIATLCPTVLHFRNIEALCEDESGNKDDRTINYFINQIKTIKPMLPVIVFCSTSRQDKLVPALQRVFLQQIAMETLSYESRKMVLNWLLKQQRLSTEYVEEIAQWTPNFVFSDLIQLLSRALKISVRKTFSENENDGGNELTKNYSEITSDEPLHDTALCKEDLLEALDEMSKSYADSIGAPEVPNVTWDDVGGLSHLKERILSALLTPILPHGLHRSGLKLPLINRLATRMRSSHARHSLSFSEESNCDGGPQNLHINSNANQMATKMFKKKSLLYMNVFLKVFLFNNGIFENSKYEKYEKVLSAFTIAFNIMEIGGCIVAIIGTKDVAHIIGVMFILPGFTLNTAAHWIFKLQKQEILKTLSLLRETECFFGNNEIKAEKLKEYARVTRTMYTALGLMILVIPSISVYMMMTVTDFQYVPTFIMPLWFVCDDSVQNRIARKFLCWGTKTRQMYVLKCAVEFVSACREWTVFLGNLYFYLLVQTAIQTQFKVLLAEIEELFSRNDKIYEKLKKDILNNETGTWRINGVTMMKQCHFRIFMWENVKVMWRRMEAENKRKAVSLRNEVMSRNVENNGLADAASEIARRARSQAPLEDELKGANGQSLLLNQVNVIVEQLRAVKEQYNQTVMADFKNVIVYYQRLYGNLKLITPILNWVMCLNVAYVFTFSLFSTLVIFDKGMFLLRLKLIMFLIYIIGSLYFECREAEVILGLNETVMRALYSTPWHRQIPSFKKIVVTFMILLQRPVVITALKIFPMSLRFFTVMMRNFYSVMNLLKKKSK